MGKRPIYVIGHKNPDTDSICSALSYAHLKRALGLENVVAARAGKVNKETQFALDYFGVEAPQLVSDVYPRVLDVMDKCEETVKETDSLRHLGEVMRKSEEKSIPVLNDAQELCGIVTVSDLAKRYFEDLDMQGFADSDVTLHDIIKTIDGNILVDSDESRVVKGNVRIAAGSVRMIADNIKSDDIVLVGDRVAPTLRACLERGIACLIVTGNGSVPSEISDLAQQKSTMIIVAPHDTYTCARLLNQCVPVKRLMQEEVVTFKPTDLISDVKKTIEGCGYRNYPVVENNQVVGMVNSERLVLSEKQGLILVDHNEAAQAVEGNEKAAVLEIIDHHRLGGINTADPLFACLDKVGCTSTLVAEQYLYHNVEIPQKLAGLMLSAIISDTVLFKSPTCTQRDQDIAKMLAKIAGVNLEKYGMELLKAGSDIGNLTAAEIIKYDMKEFQLGAKRFLVSQISVMDSEGILERKPELLKAMEKVCEEEGYDMYLVMVTNILQEGTDLLFVGGPEQIIGEAFGKEFADHSVYLPGVMSRKKQIVPQITEAVNKLG